MMAMMKTLLATLLVSAIVLPAVAAERHPVLDAWYSALLAADSGKLGDLLSSEAEIRLEDLGIVQTRQEFLDSLDEWKDAIDGGSIDWRSDPDAADDEMRPAVLVCYRFPGNDLMTRETFTLSQGKVTGSVQTTLGESCEGF